MQIHTHRAAKIRKKCNLGKSNKSISRKKFFTKIHFLQFQKWPKINFPTGKMFETAKNAISGKKLIYLISQVFLPRLF